MVLWILGSVPLQLGVLLRAWLLPRYLERLGTNTIVQHGFRVTAPGRVSIGSNCNIAQSAFIAGGGGVRIGDWVGFGPDVKVWSLNHRFENPDVPWLQQGWEYKPVVIEDDVWLAANVFVMPGVTIGRGAIVSAASVVTKSVPAFAIVAGNPGRVIGWRKRPAESEIGG
jgi:acetyltransferase-like isoleucine patch superfamily enzyme